MVGGGGGGGVVQNGRCAGQKSPNENGPLRQKLMTRDQKSKISIQHFELFRVAGQLFALQMPLLSIPPLLSLHSSSLQLSPFPFSLCLEQENGPASGLGDTHSQLRGEKALPMQSRRLSAISNTAQVQWSLWQRNK